MAVVFIARKDNSNLGWAFAESLKSVGVLAWSLSRYPNSHQYPRQATRMNRSRLVKAVRGAKVIVWMHSNYRELSDIDLEGKRFAVFHGGSRYRHHPEKMNRIFNPTVDLSLVQTWSLLGLGAKNEFWLPPPVDTDSIKPEFYVRKPFTVAHYPSQANKGTVEINSVMGELRKSRDFFYSHSRSVLPWSKNMARMAMCDIYIEQFKCPARDWGVQALEAAALGKVVVANCAGMKEYEMEFGECFLHVANTEGELKEVLEGLLGMSEAELLIAQVETKRRVEESHNYHAIGIRLKEILGIE